MQVNVKHRLCCLLLVLMLVIHQSFAQATNARPNIVLILADDLGWADLGCYGSSFYETPNLDLLAARGVRFTQGYAASPVCSPTRASLMTGKNPAKTGVTDWIRGRQENGQAKPYEKLVAWPTAYELALEEQTIAEYARSSGYATFFAGKWHLGETEKYWPQHQGFDNNKGGWSKGGPTGKINDTTGGYFTPYVNPMLPDGPKGEYLTDRLTEECLSFLEQKKTSPFFMVYSLYAVHNPLQAPTALVKKYETKKNQLGVLAANRFARDENWMAPETGWKRRLVQDNPVYAAMIENMDWNIGRLLHKLRDLKIEENTLVVFTSDNGGLSTAEGSPTVNGQLRAGKGWLYEGGIRVPLILYWKGKIVSGSFSDLPVNTVDLFPTLAKAMDEKYQQQKELDGKDIVTMLSDSMAYKKRNMVWYYPHYSNQGGRPGVAIREGAYKLIYSFEDEKVELYQLESDMSETTDIAEREKATTNYLRNKLFDWFKLNKIRIPQKNPGFDPTVKYSLGTQDH